MQNDNLKFKNKKVVILLGPPGSGKGTQAGLLSESFGLYHFETSKILERKFKKAGESPENSKERFVETDGKKYDVLEEYRIWKSGVLCSPPFVTYLVKTEIEELWRRGESLVISGSPRTLGEGKELVPLLKKLFSKENIKIVLIGLSPEETIFRNSHRKICELMRHPLIYNKETEQLTMCPLDGSKLVKRKGLDDSETIKVRLKEYQERTIPLIDYLEREKLEIKKVNGEQSVADVFKDILKAIENK